MQSLSSTNSCKFEQKHKFDLLTYNHFKFTYNTVSYQWVSKKMTNKDAGGNVNLVPQTESASQIKQEWMKRETKLYLYVVFYFGSGNFRIIICQIIHIQLQSLD